jgi:hypothetical protein
VSLKRALKDEPFRFSMARTLPAHRRGSPTRPSSEAPRIEHAILSHHRLCDLLAEAPSSRTSHACVHTTMLGRTLLHSPRRSDRSPWLHFPVDPRCGACALEEALGVRSHPAGHTVAHVTRRRAPARHSHTTVMRVAPPQRECARRWSVAGCHYVDLAKARATATRTLPNPNFWGCPCVQLRCAAACGHTALHRIGGHAHPPRPVARPTRRAGLGAGAGAGSWGWGELGFG